MLIHRYAPNRTLAARTNGRSTSFDRLFENFFGGAVPTRVPATDWVPHMDVSERDGVVRLAADLPGLRPEDVNVSVENGLLVISGERASETSDEGTDDDGLRWHRRERTSGTFRRTLRLPEDMDVDAIKATFVHGVLTVELPRKAEATPARHVIQVNTTED